MTTQHPELRYQRLIAIVFFIFYQCLFYITTFLLIYSVIYMDLKILAILGLISILQMPIRRNQKYISFIIKYIQPFKYFDKFEVIHEEEIDEKQKCIFGVHPHGLFALGVLANMNRDNGPVSRMIGLSSRFALNVPIVGLILKLWGLQAVNSDNMKRLMMRGCNIGLVPGGFEEATLTSKDELRIFIKNRKGFIKYALENNYTIRPILTLNEHQAFWTFDYLLDFRLWLNKFKFPGILYFNPKTLLFMPTSLELYSIVGKGIKNDSIVFGEKVTQKQIDQAHQAYIAQIQRLYEKYKHLNNNKPIKIF